MNAAAFRLAGEILGQLADLLPADPLGLDLDGRALHFRRDLPSGPPRLYSLDLATLEASQQPADQWAPVIAARLAAPERPR